MEYQAATKLVDGIAKEYEVDMDLANVLDEEFFDEAELRALATKVANHYRELDGKEPIEIEQEPAPEEELPDISGITDVNELARIAQAQGRKREEIEKKDYLAKREQRLRRLRGKKGK